MLGAEVLQDIGAHHIRFWVTKGFLTEARGRHSVDWQCSSFCQLRIHLARTCSRGARCMCAFPRALLRHLPVPPPIPGPQTQRTHFLWDLMFFSEGGGGGEGLGFWNVAQTVIKAERFQQPSGAFRILARSWGSHRKLENIDFETVQF